MNSFWKRIFFGAALFMGAVFFVSQVQADLDYFNPSGVHNGKDAKYQFGNVYTCSDPAGTPVTTQAGLSKTTPALVLHNVSTSTVVLGILDIGIDVTASPGAAAGFMLAVSSVVSAGPNNITAMTYGVQQNAFTGVVSTGTAMCYSISTLPYTPYAVRYLGGTTGASAIGGVRLVDPTQDRVLVSPGTAVSIQATSAAAIIAHITYEEIPFP